MPEEPEVARALASASTLIRFIEPLTIPCYHPTERHLHPRDRGFDTLGWCKEQLAIMEQENKDPNISFYSCYSTIVDRRDCLEEVSKFLETVISDVVNEDLHDVSTTIKSQFFREHVDKILDKEIDQPLVELEDIRARLRYMEGQIGEKKLLSQYDKSGNENPDREWKIPE